MTDQPKGAIECRACDGTGWMEGGTAIKSPCYRCGGLGVVSDLVHRPTPPETAKGWGCGCPQDFKHTACPLHAKSDVYLIVSPAPERGLDFEAAATESELDMADTHEIAAKRGRYWLRTQVRAFRQAFLDALNDQLQARIAEATEGVAEERQIARDDRQAVERIATLCAQAGFDNPDGTAVGAVERVLSRHAALRALVGEWQEARKGEGVKDMAETLRFAGACQALAAWEDK